MKIKIKKTILASLFDLEGKEFEVVRTETINFASGEKLYHTIIDDDGDEREICADFVEVIETDLDEGAAIYAAREIYLKTEKYIRLIPFEQSAKLERLKAEWIERFNKNPVDTIAGGSVQAIIEAEGINVECRAIETIFNQVDCLKINDFSKLCLYKKRLNDWQSYEMVQILREINWKKKDVEQIQLSARAQFFDTQSFGFGSPLAKLFSVLKKQIEKITKLKAFPLEFKSPMEQDETIEIGKNVTAKLYTSGKIAIYKTESKTSETCYIYNVVLHSGEIILAEKYDKTRKTPRHKKWDHEFNLDESTTHPVPVDQILYWGEKISGLRADYVNVKGIK